MTDYPVPTTLMEYVVLSRRTAPEKTPIDMLLNGGLGLGEEYIEYIQATTLEEKLKEAGDLCWYFASVIYGALFLSGNNVYGLDDLAKHLSDMDSVDPDWMLMDSIRAVIASIKKHKFQGHDLDLDDLITQSVSGISILERRHNGAMTQNIAKLFKRYPEGFTSIASINREE